MIYRHNLIVFQLDISNRALQFIRRSHPNKCCLWIKMLSKYLSSALVPATRQASICLTTRQTKYIAQIQRNVQMLNGTPSSRFYSDEYRRKVVAQFYKSHSGDKSTQSILYYSMSLVVLCVGLSYAAVPLYRIFCQVNFFYSAHIWHNIR